MGYLAITIAGPYSSFDETLPFFIPEVLTSSLPYLTSLPSAFLCLYFVATEFRWALPNSNNHAWDGGSRSLPSQTTRTTNNGSMSPTKLLDTRHVLALLYVVGAYYAKIHPTLTLS